MAKKKLCITCATSTGQRITHVTLGRECAQCKKTTPRGEIMVPIDEAEQ